MSTLELTLGRGLIDTDGRRHRAAVLARPDGWLEAHLAEEVDVRPGAVHVPPAVRHRVVATCLERVGGYEHPDADVVAALTRGDTDQIAFALHTAMLGPAVALVARCPNPACGELADVDLDIGDLLADTTVPEPEWFVAESEAGRVVLRPPTGADLRALDGLDDDERTAALMTAVVRSAASPDGAPLDTTWAALPPSLRTAALLALARRPVAPTTDLQVGCPTCRAVMELRVDPLVLLARRLRAGAGRLLLETHCLAYHYGWSEEAVLDLPRERRWAYLALLRAQVTGAPLEQAVDHG